MQAHMARDDSSGGSVMVGFLFGIVATAILTVSVAWLFRAAIRGPPRIDTSRPVVVREIRQLARLETVVFGMDKIVSEVGTAATCRRTWRAIACC